MNTIGPIEWPIQAGDAEAAFFDMYYTEIGEKRYVVATLGDVEDAPTLLRIESACLFGHVFHGIHCDCGDQWQKALERIIEEGHGMTIYSIDDDARGHGIKMHFELYVLRQYHGMDEEDIFEEKGKEMDIRDYGPVVEILEEFSVDSVKLMTNNPERIEVLEDNGFDVVERVPLQAEITKYNEQLLLDEKEWMGYDTCYKTHEEWREIFEEKRVKHDSKEGYLVTGGHEQILDEGFGTAITSSDIDFGAFDDDVFTTLYVNFDYSEEFVQEAEQHVDKIVDVTTVGSARGSDSTVGASTQ